MNGDKRLFGVLFISVFSAMLGLGIVVPLLPIYAEGLEPSFFGSTPYERR